MVSKSINEINERIKDGSVSVVTAEEMVGIVAELGAQGAAKEVDVVTTGTFGAMCSSGVFLNFGHSEPPIKMQRIWLNDVEAYTGVAAVDAYIGATQVSETLGMEYGGAHVIEDLIKGNAIEVHATSPGTDCYPRKVLDTTIDIDDLNQAIMLNPRNAYQRYNAATNSTSQKLYTYMGLLMPNFGNVTYSGAGVLSPLSNDPEYRTIGTGTRIFLGGAQGYIVGQGTQHSSTNGFGTLMIQGDLKEMDQEFINASTFTGYGTSLYVGMGIPIPVLDEKIAQATAVSDADIITKVLDYGVPSRDRPVVRQVTYEELRSGSIDIKGCEVVTSSLSSFKRSRQVAGILKDWIAHGEFFLSQPAERLPLDTISKPMKQTRGTPMVKNIMTKNVITIHKNASVYEAAKKIMDVSFTHLPVVTENNTLVGIVTAWDISKAVAQNTFDLVENIMTKKVVTAMDSEQVTLAARRLEQYRVSAMPVVDGQNHVIGIITSDDISMLFARRD
ncbi:homocysteine biosynthesis protein [Methanomethylovorans sp.]|uniref:homocysteine biosynthesis protein n=1 Tax=Methanomethylovorans sp. TaxID=2758717 RepID=UPI000AA94A7E|nr:homocysteine biosynthesis protein [Methanomethylovorans sp.]